MSSRIFITLICLFVFGGCSSSQKVDASAALSSENAKSEFNPDNFTTKDRPTHMLETAWGAIEVYDPAQDQDVLNAIEEIYERGDVFYGDVDTISPLKPVKADALYSVRLVRHARYIQNLDMARAGCTWIDAVPCQRGTTLTFRAPCDISSFGSAKISNCENNSFGSPYDIDMRAYKVRSRPGYDSTAYHVSKSLACSIAGIDGPYIRTFTKVGKLSGYTVDETKTLLTRSECSEWSSNSDFSILSSAK